MRQGIKYSIVTYLFMLVSIAASLFLFPLDSDLYGSLVFFVDTSLLIVPLVIFGMGMVSVRFYPELKEKFGGGNAIVNIAFLIILITTCILGCIGYVFSDLLVGLFEDKSKIFDIASSLWFFLPLLMIIGCHNFLISHISNFRLVAFPRLVQSLWRVSLPLIFVGVYFDYITPYQGLLFTFLHFLLAALVLLFYLNRLEPVRIELSSKLKKFISRRDIQQYALFVILTSLGSSLAFKLDAVMVTALLDASNTGVYSIGNRIGSIIAVPSAAIFAIAAPVISSAMEEKNFDKVNSMYVRSSEILTIAAVILVSGLAVIIYDLFSIMSNGDEMVAQGALDVVVIIAFARLFDMMTSLNHQIINLSSHFRYNLIFLGFLAGLNIALNLVLVPSMGVPGAALATLISLVTYNIIKLIFIKKMMKMWPFTKKTLFILGIGICSTLLVLGLDTLLSFSSLINLMIKGGTVVLLITSSLYFLKISADFNHVIDLARNKVFR